MNFANRYPNSEARGPRSQPIARRLRTADHEEDWALRRVAGVIGAIATAALIPGIFSVQAIAQAMFPDVPADYWAQPYIEKLAQEGIVEGYLDGTFRPERVIDRDEYAALIRQAFDTEEVRSLESASTLGDVPEDYWAEGAIEEAYEGGFMGLPQENQFNPQMEVSRVEAILALVEGLELSTDALQTATATTPPPSQRPMAQAQRDTPFHLAFPMASTQIMQIFAPPRPLQAAPQAAPHPAPQAAAEEAQTLPDLSTYYTDADQVPDYAVDEVALATQLGLIVNHPNPQLLNPTQPMTRGSAAALIHQAMVYQNQLEPLPEGSVGSRRSAQSETVTALQ